MFTDLFGGAPHARVFDFLAEQADRDHTIMEMTRGSGVARPTVYKVVDDFVAQGLIEETRTLGNSRFFQIDRENEMVRRLLQVVKPAEFADFQLRPAAAAGTAATGTDDDAARRANAQRSRKRQQKRG